MKTDRLYALTLYLLNHGKTPASELAKYFEVSVRTIQRDIDAYARQVFQFMLLQALMADMGLQIISGWITSWYQKRILLI